MHGDLFNTDPFTISDESENLHTAIAWMDEKLKEYDRQVTILPNEGTTFPVLGIVPIYFINRSTLAEHFIVKKADTSNLTTLFNEITDFMDNEGLHYEGENILAFASWLDDIAGEIAFFKAFPRKMPSWKLYYLGED